MDGSCVGPLLAGSSVIHWKYLPSISGLYRRNAGPFPVFARFRLTLCGELLNIRRWARRSMESRWGFRGVAFEAS